MEDNTDFVKQGAAIAMAFVLQQFTKNNNDKVEAFREKLMEILRNKTKEQVLTKFGCIIAMGILESGGRNSVVKLVSEAKTTKKGAITGML